MFRLAFVMGLLIFGLAMAALTSGGSGGGAHDSEIDIGRGTPVERIAHTGLNDPDTLDAWIAREFYIGRFDVTWSADPIANGKVRVTANMTSYSQLRLEQSILLRFDIDPKDKDSKVTFAGMVIGGAEVATGSGKSYSLEDAMTRMWERRNKTYLQDLPDSEDDDR